MIRSTSKRVAMVVLGVAVAALMVSAAPTTSTPTPTATAASSDYFLKLDGIDGESSDPGHEGAIQIESWSWGMTTQMGSDDGSTGGAATGKATFSDLSVMKRIDKGSPLLAKACATGEHIKTAKLFVTRKAKGGNEDFYKITLSDVTCSSLQQAGTASDMPTESVTFTYSKIEWEYLPQNSSTWLKTGYDLKLNKGI